MVDVIIDTLLDSVKLLPFLFITYLLMEYLEHKADAGSKNAISKAGRFGPVVGGVLGAVPQCGFSTAASNLFAGRVITPGTIVAIFLSTSDEMLPIFISESVNTGFIIKVLLLKICIGAVYGLLVDAVYYNLLKKKTEKINICHICEREKCHCIHEHYHEHVNDDDKHIKAPGRKSEEEEHDEGILKPAFVHTIHIFIFVILFSFALNTLFYYIGEDKLKELVVGREFISVLICGLIGLIPNCAASVVITQLYLEEIISFGAMMSGLLAGAGIGILILFRINDRVKENISILITIYLLGVITGIILDMILGAGFMCA